MDDNAAINCGFVNHSLHHPKTLPTKSVGPLKILKPLIDFVYSAVLLFGSTDQVSTVSFPSLEHMHTIEIAAICVH
jgi:hypothetical protein